MCFVCCLQMLSIWLYTDSAKGQGAQSIKVSMYQNGIEWPNNSPNKDTGVNPFPHSDTF